MYTPRVTRPRRPQSVRRTPTPAKRALDFGVSSVAKRVRYTPGTIQSAGTRGSLKTNYKLEIGEPVGSSSCKNRATLDTSNVTTAYNSNTPISFGNALSIPQGTAINQRLGRTVNLRGITLEGYFNLVDVNALQNQDIFYLHYAVLVPKDSTPSPTPTPVLTDFFRAYGSNRGVDFSASLTPLDLMKNPINTDVFEVLLHKSCMLAPFLDQLAFTGNAKQIDHYIPIARQCRFASADEGSAEDTVWVVFWYTTKDSTAAAPLVNMQFRFRTVLHYREAIN